MAALTAKDLYILADLLERLVVGREPTLQVANAELTFCILFITGALARLFFFDGFSHLLRFCPVLDPPKLGDFGSRSTSTYFTLIIS